MKMNRLINYSADLSIDEMIHKADKFMLLLFWLHVPFTGYFASYSYGTWREGLFSGLAISLIGTISYLFSKGTFGHRLLNALLLLSYSIVLITLQFGRIEMHFHIFAVLPFLILYKDWKIIPPAAILIAIHHSVFNYCQANGLEFFGLPLKVFNYDNGWDIVLLHTFFVIFQSCVLIYYSILFKKQHNEVREVNRNLENIVEERTQNLKNEKDKIESYKNTLDKIALTTIFDNDGIILTVNNNQTFLTEYSNEELVGQSIDLIYSNNLDLLKEVWSSLIDGHIWSGEVKEVSKGGRVYWVDSVISPVWDSNRNIKYFMEIKFDITDKVNNELMVKKQQAQIISQSKLSSLGEMAGGIAHEINNPLAIISFSIMAIRKMIDKGMEKTIQFTEALDDIDNTILRITKIVDGLRNVSRDTTNEIFDKVLVKDIINDSIALSSEKFKSHDVKLELIHNDEILDLEVDALRVQLSQVLINLLTNSYDEIIRYDDKWIKVFLNREEENLVIKVMDCGNGIPDEIAEKMFQPFFTTKEIGKGTGLGMSLSHTIVKKHKGNLYLDTSCDHTCFIISIPIFQQ